MRKINISWRTKNSFLAASFLFFAFLPFLIDISFAQEKSIIISAVQTSGSKSTDDFIELYNDTCADIDLDGWKIKRRMSNDNSGTTISSESAIGTLRNTIPGKGYFLWKNISANASGNPDYSTTSYSLSDNYSIALFNAAEEQIDALTWGNNLLPFSDVAYYPLNLKAFEAILRNTSDETSTRMNYAPKNSSVIETENLSECPTEEPDPDPIVPNTEIDPIKTYSDKLRLNEVLPNPKNDEAAGEYIELYNEDSVPIDLEGWILKDSSKTSFVFPAGYIIGTEDYLLIHRNTFKFTLNNTGSEDVYLLDPNESVVSEVNYEDAKENVSFGFDGSAWKWSTYLTPGKMNEFSNPARIKAIEIKEGYIGTLIEFSLDPESDNFSKVTWDFGDKKKSYLKNPTHTYLEKGTYSVSVSASGEVEDVSDSFNLKITDYPREKVTLVGLLPNPAGTDSDQEWIEVRNDSDDTVNLKGWKIATGQKMFTNHLIKEDLEINPGDTAQLTREFSYFTLHNSSMKLELRYPDGKVADKVSYSKKNIGEDEIYSKIDGRWIWISPEEESLPETDETSDEISSLDEDQKLLEEKPTTETFLEEIHTDDLGFSPSPEWENKKKNRLLYLAYGLDIEGAPIGPLRNASLPISTSESNFNILLQINSFFNKLFF